ncbi:hypothetical protein OTU49_007659, partial [Cherax quadricarinatus]
YVQPICSPTRSALLSGRYPFTIGRQHSVLSPGEPKGLDLQLKLLPQALKESGYHTHAVGKWHLGFCSWDYTPTLRGFDTFYGYYTGSEDYFTHQRSRDLDSKMDSCNNVNYCYDLNNSTAGKTTGTRKQEWLDLRNNTTPDSSQDGVYSTYMFASYVEELLRSRSAEEPMFLYLPLQSVHAPLQVPDNYTTPYLYITDTNRRTYLGMVSAMDEAVGRVVAALKTTGHYDNSVIIFTSDNGGSEKHGGNNWPLRGHKATMWEGGTRGAAFLHSPLLPNPGTISHQLVHVTDWYKTLVGVAGGDTPTQTDGVDQWASFIGSEPPPRTHMVYNIDNTTDFQAGVRKGKYKLLVGPTGKGDWTPPPELRVSSDTAPLLQSVIDFSSDFHSHTARLLSKQPFTKADLARHPLYDPVLLQTLPTDVDGLKDGSNELSPSEAGSQTGLKSSSQVFYVPQSKTKKRQLISAKSGSLDVEGINISRVDIAKISNIKYKNKHNQRTQGEWSTEDFKGGAADKIKTTSDEIWASDLQAAIQLLQQLANTNDTKIQLYNVEEDPEERVDLVSVHVDVVEELLQYLLEELQRYVPADIFPEVPEASPDNFDGVWSPGWC